jgi:hypothetical protein
MYSNVSDTFTKSGGATPAALWTKLIFPSPADS